MAILEYWSYVISSFAISISAMLCLHKNDQNRGIPVPYLKLKMLGEGIIHIGTAKTAERPFYEAEQGYFVVA